MNRLFLNTALGALALLALTCRGYAQDDTGSAAAADTATQDAPQSYQVEIILFANANADSNEELFSAEQPKQLPASPLPLQPLPYGVDTERLQSVPGSDAAPAPPPAAGPAPAILQPAGTAPAAPQADATDQLPDAGAQAGDALQPIPGVPGGDAASATAQAVSFRLLKPDELRLNDEYAKIERLGAYRPLGHAGWVQQGLPEDQARPIDMAELGIDNPSGTIQLHVSRYPHVTVNLTYRANPDPSSGDQAAEAATQGDESGLGTVAIAPRYVMHQQRRVRSGELQYFDHPMFGLLFLITPAPKKPPEHPAENSGELTPAA